MSSCLLACITPSGKSTWLPLGPKVIYSQSKNFDVSYLKCIHFQPIEALHLKHYICHNNCFRDGYIT